MNPSPGQVERDPPAGDPGVTEVGALSDLFLAVLPYLLLAVALLLVTSWPLSVVLPYRMRGPLFVLAQWGLRLTWIAVAVYAWNVRASWRLSWQSMALYATVGGLLNLATLAGNWLFSSALTALLIGLPWLALAFAPWVVAIYRLAKRNRERALWLALPHAVATAPLFALAVAGQEEIAQIRWGIVLAVLWAGLAQAIGPHITDQRRRTLILFGSVPIGALLFLPPLVGIRNDWGLSLIFPLFMLTLVGFFILSGPFLLPVAGAVTGRSIRRRPFGGLRVAAEAGEKQWHSLVQSVASARQARTVNQGGSQMTTPEPSTTGPAVPRQPGVLDRLYRVSVVVLAAFVVLGTALTLLRVSLYKVHEYERGLHLRGGRFISLDEPGWHWQIPLVDTVILVRVSERLGYIERIPAMTKDDVTMDVSLEYTFRVADPDRFALQVADPDRIVFEFVQGKLRDVVNAKSMTEVMHSRAEMNREVMLALQGKEEQYGVQFITVQMQSASPPEEVVAAIKDRMVAAQKKEQAMAEAEQTKTLADASFYKAQKEADAAAYEIEKRAAAEAERIRQTAGAQEESVRLILGALEGKGTLAEKYLDLLMTQELKENSKWILSGDSTPLVDLRK